MKDWKIPKKNPTKNHATVGDYLKEFKQTSKQSRTHAHTHSTHNVYEYNADQISQWRQTNMKFKNHNWDWLFEYISILFFLIINNTDYNESHVKDISLWILAD